MSFILDALKKSESDRQRQNGPGLYEVKVAAPRSQLPYWAIGLAVLLGVNLVIVAWALLRRSSHTPAASGPAAALTAPAPSGPAPPAASTGPGATTPPQPTVAAQAPPAPSIPAAATPAASTPAASTPAAAGPVPAGVEPQPAPAAGAAQVDPDDYAPAREPSQSSGVSFHVRRATESGVPLYSEAGTAPGSGVPQLRLDLHAYAPRPEDRFVLINMKKLREGDSLPEGVKVESITPDGVILSHNGSRFLLPRE